MTDYKMLESQAEELLREEPDGLASAANFVALLYNAIDDINWLGIYVMRDNELVAEMMRAFRRAIDVAGAPGRLD